MTVQEVLPPLAEPQATPTNLAVVSTFFPEAVTFALPDNLTIAEMMAASRISKRMQKQSTCIIRNIETGKERRIPRRVWQYVKVRPGEKAILRSMPAGGGRGGGKSTLGLVLSIVVMAASAFASFGVASLIGPGTALGLSSSIAGGIGSLAGGLVGLVGKLAVSALVPPPKQSRAKSKGGSFGRADSPSYSITGTQNRLAQYEPLARIYGRMRHTPVYGALPYTEINGSDQYLRCLFSFGYGPLEFDESSFKLGETPLSQFQGVQYQVHESYGGTGLSIYTNDVFEDELAIEIANDGIRTAAVAATATLTFTGNAADGETFTIGSRVYTFKGTLGTAANQILIGGSVAATIDNTVAAINRSGSTGTQYTSATTPNTQVTADAPTTTTLKITAITAGTAANSIATTDTVTNASWGGATMSGGVAQVAIPQDSGSAGNLGYLRMTVDEKWVSARTQTAIDEFSCDITFPEGLVLYREDRNDGFTARLDWTVRFDVRYRAAGTSDPWIYLSTQSTNVLTASANPTNGETAVMDGKTYNFRTALSDVDGYVQIGADLATTLANLKAAINLEAGAGALYAASTTEHETIEATAVTATTLTVTAKRMGHITGIDGDRLAVSDTMANASWASAKFTGGVDALKATAADNFVRRGIGPEIPDAAGQFDVEIRRLSKAAVNDGPGRIDRVTIRDKATWTRLRSIKHQNPVDQTGVALVEMRFKATGQLQQVIENFNAVVTSKLRTWNGTTWTAPVATRTAAWIALDILQGSANPQPVADARIYLPSFKDWADRDEALGDDGEPLYTCDGPFDFLGTVGEALSDVAATGRASVGLMDGLFAAVMDTPQSVPVQMFTPRNSWDCRLKFVFSKTPHALRVRFKNEEKGYVEDEITVYDDGYNADGSDGKTAATRFETMTQPMIVRADQVWRQARYDQAVGRLRSVEYSISTDPEWFEVNRGDLCLLQYDTIRVGQKSARVKERVESGGQVVGLVLDEIVSMTTGTVYALKWRKVTAAGDYEFETISLLTLPGDDTEVTFALAMDPDDAPAVGDLVAFGEATRVTVDVLVKSIVPDDDMNAVITFIDASPSVHDADTGIPDYDPGTTPLPAPQNRKPQQPVIADIKSDEEVLSVNPDGSLRSNIVITFGTLSGGTVPVALYAARFKRTGSDAAFSPEITVPVSLGSLTLTPVDDIVSYDIEVYSISSLGVPSDVVSISHTVVGKTTPPPDPENGRIEGSEFRWDYPQRPVDLLGYVVRINPGGEFSWTGATIQPEGFLAENRFDISGLGRGTYAVMVKAIDTGLRVSDGYAGSTLIVGAPVFKNIVETFDISGGGFTGTITNGSVISSVLTADVEAAAAWSSTETDAAWSSTETDAAWGGSAAEMTYLDDVTPGADSVGAELIIDAVISGASWALYYSTDGTTYLPWPGSVTVAASTTYYIKLVTTGGSAQGEVSELQVYTQVPDETEHLDDIAIAAAGTRLPITKNYLSIRNINPVIRKHAAETAIGIHVEDYNVSTGPLVYLTDSTGAYVDGHCDFDPVGAKDMDP
jgi:hypothetical protein